MGLFSFATEGQLSKDEVCELMLPLYDDFCYVFHSAWDEWQGQIPAATRDKVTPMQRGGFVNDLAVDYAKNMFRNREKQQIHICEKLNFFKLYIGGTKIVARLKKLQPDYTVPASAYSSHRQARLWYKNSHIPGLVNSATRLTIGYILNPIETEISEIAVSSQIGPQLLWGVRIHDEAHSIDGVNSVDTTKKIYENEGLPEIQISPTGERRSQSN
ncbi:hypothetical protein Pan241w_35530 [Gimesia alba]|uniref:Uncharacterized protein n=1 Tax=Gimesia alba TaxID=2527973 RepID=A0A517RHV3_9PLAN|nr:hypothetical protein [Gimesia alba]QDT43452.1 hypothetical protein Pan241w_35530 [Gimesia alba]